MRTKLVIVEDDAPTLAALKRLLRPSFEIEGFSDPERASSWLKNGALFDLALFDAVMPGPDGFELLAQVRSTRPGTPVVMLSGRPELEVVVKAIKQGACDFIAKPFQDARTLAARLAQAVTGRSVRDSVFARLEDDHQPLPRYSDARQTVMTDFQRAYLDRLMRDAKGSVSLGSRLSGIDRTNLRRALAKHKKDG